MHWISPDPLHLPLITYTAQIIHGWKKKEGNGEHDKYTFQNRIWRISVGRKKNQ